MPTQPLGPFRGIDARPGAADRAGGLLEGLNVIDAADGGLIRRPALTVRSVLPAGSIGLYAVGDQLRMLAPYIYDTRLTTANPNTAGATTLNVTPAVSGPDATAFLPASGTFRLDYTTPTLYTYTGKTASSLTGVTPPLAYTYPAGQTVKIGPELLNQSLFTTISVDYITDPSPRVIDDLIGQVTGSDGKTVALVHYTDESTEIHACSDANTSPGIIATTTASVANVVGDVALSVVSTASFTYAGSFVVTGPTGNRRYTYSGKTATQFTGVFPPLSEIYSIGASVSFDGTNIRGLGFTPEFSLVRAAGRAFVLDGSLRYLRYSNIDSASPSSLVDFTSNPQLTSGSGFLEVSQFASGAGSPQGLTLFGGRIVVFYRGSVLIYRIDADQSRFFLEQQINGPGTRAPRSAVELGADTIFLSDAGVRVLSTVVQTLDAREDAIGGRIDHLAKQYMADVNIVPVGHYARRLGCYLLAFGQDVLCLAVLPGSAILGWTRWRLPVPVTAWAEAGGTLWMRSGNTLYAFEDNEDRDEVSLGAFQDIPVLVETLPLRGTTQSTAVSVSAASVEPVRVQVVADGRPGVDINGAPLGQPITLPPRAPEPARALVGKIGRTFSVRVYDAAATSGWRLDNLWLEVAR